jgi:hypothetical protein
MVVSRMPDWSDVYRPSERVVAGPVPPADVGPVEAGVDELAVGELPDVAARPDHRLGAGEHIVEEGGGDRLVVRGADVDHAGVAVDHAGRVLGDRQGFVGAELGGEIGRERGVLLAEEGVRPRGVVEHECGRRGGGGFGGGSDDRRDAGTHGRGDPDHADESCCDTTSGSTGYPGLGVHGG